MSEYQTHKLDEGFYCIEQDYVRCFLIEGDREALLVDTGFGNGDLKNYIEGITKLPLSVIFTHADGDHIGCAAQFERRFMHPSEYENYMSRHENAVSMEAIWEGNRIDLGNYCFEVILLPGHTPGSIALLEKEKRFLIAGDSVQKGKIYMFGSGRNFYAYLASMNKLKERSSEFDRVYASHDQLCVEPALIHQLILGATEIIEGRVEGIAGELSFDQSIKCYSNNGVMFYAR